MTDIFDGDGIREWLAQAERDMMPKMKASVMSITIFNGHIDAKVCVQIGAAILYNKPLILFVTEGAFVPPALERAAVEIVRGNYEDPRSRELMVAAIKRVVPRNI